MYKEGVGELMITDDIIKWVENQPYWQRMIAAKLLNNDDITEEYLEGAFLAFKKVNKLNTDTLEKE